MNCRSCGNRVASFGDLFMKVRPAGVFMKLVNVDVSDDGNYHKTDRGTTLAGAYCVQCRAFIGWKIIGITQQNMPFLEGTFVLRLESNQHVPYEPNMGLIFRYLMHILNQKAYQGRGGNQQNHNKDGGVNEKNIDQDGGNNKKNADQHGGGNEQNHDQDGGSDQQVPDEQDLDANEQNVDQDGSANEQNVDQDGGANEQNADEHGGGNEQNHDQDGGANEQNVDQDGGGNEQNQDQDGDPPKKRMKI